MGLLGKNSRTFRPEWEGRSNHPLLPETAKVRRIITDQIRNGVVGFTAGQLNKLFKASDLPDDGKNGGRYRVSAYKFLLQRGWKKQTLKPSCIICYSPAASPDQVAALAKEGLVGFQLKSVTAAQLSFVARTAKQEERRQQDARLSREKLKEELIKEAMGHNDPLVAYVHRAAKVCGVVRGYRWP